MSSINDIRSRLEACPIPEDAQAGQPKLSEVSVLAWIGSALDYATHYRRDVAELLSNRDAMAATVDYYERYCRDLGITPVPSIPTPAYNLAVRDQEQRKIGAADKLRELAARAPDVGFVTECRGTRAMQSVGDWLLEEAEFVKSGKLVQFPPVNRKEKPHDPSSA